MEEIKICEECHAVLGGLIHTITTTDGRTLCQACATRADYVECRECGDWVKYDDVHWDEYEHDYICNDCYDNDGYNTCNDCGRITDDTTTVHKSHNRDVEVCDHCLNGYYFCDDCEEYYSHYLLWRTDDRISICDNCAENYCYCEDCGTILNIGDEYQVNGETYCFNCADDHKHRHIHDYSYKPRPVFFGDNMNNTVPYMGIEVEADKGNDPQECAGEIHEITDCVYCKHDGSLDDGIEVVSHPATIAYHTTELPWRDIFDKLREYDFTSHNAGTCGLHVHINRTFFHDHNSDVQDLHIAKIILMINKFWDNLVIFSRRNMHELQQWAKKPDMEIEEDDSEYTIIEKAKDTRYGGRYQAINLENRNTIEFRMFRGTLKYSTFLATLQLVEYMVVYAKTHDLKHITQVSWNDFISNNGYTELTDYCISKKIMKVED